MSPLFWLITALTIYRAYRRGINQALGLWRTSEDSCADALLLAVNSRHHRTVHQPVIDTCMLPLSPRTAQSCFRGPIKPITLLQSTMATNHCKPADVRLWSNSPRKTGSFRWFFLRPNILYLLCLCLDSLPLTRTASSVLNRSKPTLRAYTAR